MQGEERNCAATILNWDTYIAGRVFTVSGNNQQQPKHLAYCLATKGTHPWKKVIFFLKNFSFLFLTYK